MSASVRLTSPRALPETARTLRRLGLRISVDGALTIASNGADPLTNGTPIVLSPCTLTFFGIASPFTPNSAAATCLA